MAQLAPVHVVWFKRDLRVDDHAALSQAAAMGTVLPLFIIEPDLLAEPDQSGRQWAFALECLAELREDLAALGQPLIIRSGDAVAVLEDLHAQAGIAALWSHQETGNSWTFARDRRVAAWANRHTIAWHQLRQHGITRRLPSRNGWARDWDALMAEPVRSPPSSLRPLAISDIGALPTVRDLPLAPDDCPGRQRGGRTAAKLTLDSFLTERGQRYRYEMSSPVTAFDACSRLSAHFAWGSVSIREAAQLTWQRMRDLKRDQAAADNASTRRTTADWRGSMISFSGRLHWHCHFMQKLESEPRLEFESLHRAYRDVRPATPDTARLEAWQSGRTGFPFVDACMRALNATGWLNFRMRAMLMSFASYQLWLPWRPTGLHLARAFTDYEPGIHWPQVQMQSGTTGINTLRIYNPVKQSLDQDRDGQFIRTWLPELDAVPDGFIHEPWRWDRFEAEIAHAYPRPIVDHIKAAKSARDAVWSVRKTKTVAREADAIQDKHGSRRSGIPMTGSPSGRVRKAKANADAHADANADGTGDSEGQAKKLNGQKGGAKKAEVKSPGERGQMEFDL